MATKKTATDLFDITNDLLDERLLSTNHYLDDDWEGWLADHSPPPATPARRREATVTKDRQTGR